ncbi:MAG: TIGR00730 family Rossman fold protein [Opitutaceae bacterium]|nr:TIGR00730 family Rossman fold protein [Opitutaceae bacterium]
MKLLCVYCSSSLHLSSDYYEMADRVGRELVSHGWGLVYGGGNAGLMGSVAQGVKAAGGVVVGVIPEFMKVRELAFTDADELISVSTMAERKKLMIDRADAFLALPGGIGTLEEISEVLTLRYLGQMDKHIVFINQNGYYDHLFRFFEHMQSERFKTSGMEGLYDVATTVEDIWTHLHADQSYEADQLWKETH